MKLRIWTEKMIDIVLNIFKTKSCVAKRSELELIGKKEGLKKKFVCGIQHLACVIDVIVSNWKEFTHFTLIKQRINFTEQNIH